MPRDSATLSSDAFVDEQHIGRNRFREENSRGFTWVQSEIDLGQFAVVNSYPMCALQGADARCCRSPLDDFVPASGTTTSPHTTASRSRMPTRER
jgi:hypothetical protein